MAEFAGVIFAGGLGERLGGVRKANLRLGGTTFLQRACKALDGAAPLLLAVGRDAHPYPGILIADPPGELRGPLAGLAAAVGYLVERSNAPRRLVTAAVDTPHIPHDFAAAMNGLLTGWAPGAVVRSHRQLHPTHAIWNLDALRELPDRVRAGSAPKSLMALVHEVGAMMIDWPDRGSDPFASVNTVAELIAAARTELSTG